MEIEKEKPIIISLFNLKASGVIKIIKETGNVKNINDKDKIQSICFSYSLDEILKDININEEFTSPRANTEKSNNTLIGTTKEPQITEIFKSNQINLKQQIKLFNYIVVIGHFDKYINKPPKPNINFLLKFEFKIDFAKNDMNKIESHIA